MAVGIIGIIGAMAYIGWDYKNTRTQVNDMFQSGVLITHYGMVANMQRVYGGPNEYRASLLAVSEALDQAKELYPNNPLHSEKSYCTDKMLVYTRLARLEEEQDNIDQFEQYKGEATKWCRSVPWRNCNWEFLMEVTTKFDKNSFFNKAEEK